MIQYQTMAVLKHTTDGKPYGAEWYIGVMILWVVAFSIIGLFKWFRANMDVHKEQNYGKHHELPITNISGVYRPKRDPFTYGSMIQETTPETLTAFVVKLEEKENGLVSNNICPVEIKALSALHQPKLDAPATLLTPVVESSEFVTSSHARINKDTILEPNKSQNITNKKQDEKINKNKVKAEKKPEKAILKEDQLKEKQRIRKKQVILEKGHTAVDTVREINVHKFPSDSTSISQSNTSVSSPPPPYKEIITRQPQSQNLIMSLVDESGNVSFAQPTNGFASNWDLISNHRQNIKRAKQP